MRYQGEELHCTSTRLEDRNRELDAFAGRVAHDLRGPLMTISLSASRLSERAPLEEGTAAVLQRGVSQMDRLIQDLLTLSRIDGHTLGTVSQTTTVAAAVEQDLGPPVMRVHGLLHITVEPAEVGCSEGLLRDVLWNLGENAVKYRRPDVQLEISIQGRELGRSYEFRVSDNGTGMSSQEARHAFEPFFRGEQARLTPGTGLGLSIVRRVIEAHAGTVSIDSQAERGTTFIINLPRVGGQ